VPTSRRRHGVPHKERGRPISRSTPLQRPRRSLLVIALLALVLAGSACSPAAAPAGGGGRHEPRVINARAFPTGQEPTYEFVAAPDFLNQDVGDLRSLPSWQAGDPNSWTPELQQSIDRFLDEIASLEPGSVLVPGDLVEGRWGIDRTRSGIFGPVRTTAQKRQALRRAARFYFSTYLERFQSRGLTLHAALGDHDIGDNPWDDHSAETVFKRQMMNVFKEEFARQFTHLPSGKPRYRERPVGTIWSDTAYAVHLSPDVLLVSLDEFHRRDGDVHFEVEGGQLRWLRATLRQARADGIPWVVVQGHNPILVPVREVSSSGGHLEGGRRSPLWRTMARFGVDLYLNGEVHATTLRQADGVTQVSTGGLLYKGDATYLVARVFDDRMELDVRKLQAQLSAPGKLWQTTGHRTRAFMTYADEPSRSIGSMTLTSDGRALNQIGLLQAYRG